jgi:SAM-dependent MidA family methyltransferase
MTSADPGSNLPPLQAEEQQHSERVLQAVRAALAAHGGWLAFDDYLRIVLYSPGLGYYSAGSAIFGGSGDFVTAPELSVLFSRCVARQCMQVLQQTGGDILELGGGSGALAAGVLTTLQERGLLPEHYYLLEVSAALRQRQQQRIGALPAALRSRVQWLESMPGAPISGVILANEVADALPFKRFVTHAEGLLERGVALSAHGQLIDADRAAEPALQAQVAQLVASLAPHPAPWPWPSGYQSELCPLLAPWIAAIAAALGRGAALLIDYGLARSEYYHPQRWGGTLRCHFRHRAHEQPLLYPGLQDISAWVDFTRVAEAAVDAGLSIAGYCSQAAFLLGTGIEADLADSATALERARLASEARQLLLPEAMGESVKVMALTREPDAALRGFQYQDLRGSL